MITVDDFSRPGPAPPGIPPNSGVTVGIVRYHRLRAGGFGHDRRDQRVTLGAHPQAGALCHAGEPARGRRPAGAPRGLATVERHQSAVAVPARKSRSPETPAMTFDADDAQLRRHLRDAELPALLMTVA